MGWVGKKQSVPWLILQIAPCGIWTWQLCAEKRSNGSSSFIYLNRFEPEREKQNEWIAVEPAEQFAHSKANFFVSSMAAVKKCVGDEKLF